MERWLDQAHAEGRFTHVLRPFILDPETTVETMLKPQGPGAEQAFDSELLTIALAQALSEPKEHGENLELRVAILGRSANDLSESGMRSAGNALADWCENAPARSRRGRETETWQEIRKMQGIIHAGEVSRTRAAEDRRIEMEETPARPKGTTRPGTRRTGGVTG